MDTSQVLQFEFADEFHTVTSVPSVRFRPVTTDGYRHYRLVIRSYGRRDPRWLRERMLILTSGDRMGFPYVRDIWEREDEVTTLEAGGVLMLRDLIRRTVVRRRAEAALPVLAPMVVAVLFRTLAEALAQIHAQHLCYRALSDETVLVDAQGFRLLTTACVGPVEKPDQEPEETQVTRFYHLETTAPFGGTTPPERLEGVTVPGGDVYSMGILMFQALTGRQPVKVERGIPAYSAQHIQTEMASLRSRLQGIPGEHLVDVIERCLSRDPERRPGADAIAEMLFQIEYGEAPRVSRTHVDLVLQFLLAGRFQTGAWGARQQQAWRQVYERTPPMRGASFSPPPSGSTSSDRSTVRRLRLRTRLRMAWHLLRTGHLPD